MRKRAAVESLSARRPIGCIPDARLTRSVFATYGQSAAGGDAQTISRVTRMVFATFGRFESASGPNVDQPWAGGTEDAGVDSIPHSGLMVAGRPPHAGPKTRDASRGAGVARRLLSPRARTPGDP